MNIGALTQAMLQTGMTLPPFAVDTGGLSGPSFLETVARGMASGPTREVSSLQGASKTQSLEDRLRAKYPNLVYHVFDGSSRYWRSRNDYPFHKIYQQDTDVSELENWRPSGANPDPLDSQVQRNLSSIPPGSVAVIIHPKIQQKMEEDPAYADEIYNRIEAWFAFDAARNEAIIPGISEGTSKCIAIGEDGMIANAQSCSSGRITQSKSGSDDDEDDFWTARAKRFRIYMDQVVEAQILHKMGITAELSARRAISRKAGRISSGGSGLSQMTQRMAAMQSAQAAAAQTTAMMNDPQLREALGDTIAGVPIDTVFQCTVEAMAKGPYI